MIRYAITDRRALGASEADRQSKLVELARRWSVEAIDYVLLRERDLPVEEQLILARRLRQVVAQTESRTRLVLHVGVGGRDELAYAAQLAQETSGRNLGIHLSSSAPASAISVLARTWAFTSVSCHTLDDVKRARDSAASLALFAPVFGKHVNGGLITPAIGLAALREACEAAKPMPVLALGGVTLQNMNECLAAGAAGVAGIRLFL